MAYRVYPFFSVCNTQRCANARSHDRTIVSTYTRQPLVTHTEKSTQPASTAHHLCAHSNKLIISSSSGSTIIIRPTDGCAVLCRLAEKLPACKCVRRFSRARESRELRTGRTEYTQMFVRVCVFMCFADTLTHIFEQNAHAPTHETSRAPLCSNLPDTKIAPTEHDRRSIQTYARCQLGRRGRIESALTRNTEHQQQQQQQHL